MRTTMGLTLALLIGLVLTVGRADDKPTASEPTPAKVDAKVEAADAIAAAYTMAKTGRATKSPELLLAAAKVIGRTDVSKLEFKESKGKVTSTAVDLEPFEEANQMIDEAVKMGGDGSNGETIKKLAASIQNDIKEFKRGAIPGPQVRIGRVEVKSDQYDPFDMQFRGKQVARIWLHNLSGQGDLDLQVYDLDGRLIVQDTRSAGSAFVQFVPPQNNWYTVRVKAYSDVAPIRYKLVTN